MSSWEIPYYFKKPLLIQEEEIGGQGLKGIVRLHYHSLLHILYYKDSYCVYCGDYVFLEKNPCSADKGG
jgi:hypothetical protein